MTHDFKCRHFVGEVILRAVRWYSKYGVSYRELEEMMEERGVHLDNTTVYRWVNKSNALIWDHYRHTLPQPSEFAPESSIVAPDVCCTAHRPVNATEPIIRVVAVKDG